MNGNFFDKPETNNYLFSGPIIAIQKNCKLRLRVPGSKDFTVELFPGIEVQFSVLFVLVVEVVLVAPRVLLEMYVIVVKIITNKMTDHQRIEIRKNGGTELPTRQRD